MRAYHPGNGVKFPCRSTTCRILEISEDARRPLTFRACKPIDSAEAQKAIEQCVKPALEKRLETELFGGRWRHIGRLGRIFVLLAGIVASFWFAALLLYVHIGCYLGSSRSYGSCWSRGGRRLDEDPGGFLVFCGVLFVIYWIFGGRKRLRRFRMLKRERNSFVKRYGYAPVIQRSKSWWRSIW